MVHCSASSLRRNDRRGELMSRKRPDDSALLATPPRQSRHGNRSHPVGAVSAPRSSSLLPPVGAAVQPRSSQPRTPSLPRTSLLVITLAALTACNSGNVPEPQATPTAE